MGRTTTIAEKVAADMKSASWIREMFEKGLRLKKELGEDNVFDLSLGNPNAPPPPKFFAALQEVAAAREPVLHRYMPNAGFPDCRAAIAKFLSSVYQHEFDGNSVILTVGAAGATNVTLRAICNPGDEVIVLAPFFPEYRFYIEQANARMVVVPTDDDFVPDVPAIEKALSDKTKAVLVCSPNNPTGAVYDAPTCEALGRMLSGHDRAERPIYLLCDNVYHRVVFDEYRCPSPSEHYFRSIVLASFSKELGIAGERAGYIAVPPTVPVREELLAAMTMLNRTLGFVNCSALIQRIVAKCADSLCDISLYRENRDLLCSALRDFGYELPQPGGALFAFPKTPVDDDVTFVDKLLEHHILAVPGRGFGRSGHMRLSFCVDRKTIERALPGFEKAIKSGR